MKKLIAINAALLGLLVLAAPSPAQIIWSAPVTLTGDSDISTAGSYVDAATFGATITDNTVQFNAITGGGGGAVGTTSIGDISLQYQGSVNYGGADFPTSPSASATYSALVSTIGYGYYFQSPDVVTLSGLSAGSTYQVQVFDFDGNDAVASVGTTLTGATPVTFNDPNAGQYSIGTFTATGSTETFDYEGTTTSNNFQVINDISLRDLGTTATPEPSATVLLGLGGLGIALLLRRKRVV